MESEDVRGSRQAPTSAAMLLTRTMSCKNIGHISYDLSVKEHGVEVSQFHVTGHIILQS